MSEEHSKSVAIVTGGGRGVGAATARLLARSGSRVVVASRTQRELDEVVASIEAAGGEATAVATDVGDEAAIESLFTRTLERYGQVDLLVNDAATIEVTEVVDLDAEAWDRIQNVNLRGSFLCARALLRHCRDASHGGAIVNISSLGGIRGTDKFPGFAAYTVSKFGVIGLTECLAVEGRALGVRVNCVAPGAVDTKMLRDAAPFLKTDTTPEDVAEIIAFLCDDARSGAMTGSTLEIRSNLPD